MAKLKPNEKRVQLSFQRPDDVALYAFLENRAYERRYDLPTFILLSLHEAFEGQIEPPAEQIITITQPEIHFESILADPSKAESPTPTSPAPQPTESTDDGYESTKAEIAKNIALYQKKRGSKKGVIPGADTAPASPPAP